MKASLLAEKMIDFSERLHEGIALVDNTCTGPRRTIVIKKGFLGWGREVRYGKLVELEELDKLTERIAWFVEFLLSKEYPDIAGEMIKTFMDPFCEVIEQVILTVNTFCDGEREFDIGFGLPYLTSLQTLYELYVDMQEFTTELVPA